jgi:hypothetical protein
LEKILNPFGDSDLDFFCALSLAPLRTEPTSLRKKKKAAGQGTETKTERKKRYRHYIDLSENKCSQIRGIYLRGVWFAPLKFNVILYHFRLI